MKTPSHTHNLLNIPTKIENYDEDGKEDRPCPEPPAGTQQGQGAGVAASMDFLYISDRPQLQRRMQATVVACTKGTPIEVSSGSTGKKRKSSIAAGLAKVTESINKIRDSSESFKDRRSKDMVDIVEKQLDYFRCQDCKINKT